MVDHTTGSFGYYNPMGNSFSSIGGMYMLGGDNINQTNTPNISSMYGSSAQQYFNPYNVAPAGYGYQQPQQVIHNYGFSDLIQYGIIGKPMSLGMHPMDNAVSRREYAVLARTTIAGDVAGVAVGAGLGSAAMAVGGFAGGALGATALALPFAISSGIDTRIENYKRTQRIGAIFSNIVNSDGTIGLTGRQAARVTKMLDKASANDLIMDSDDMANALSAAKDNGMLAQVSDTIQIEQKLKQLTKTLKMAADIMGSSDLKAVMEEMGKFNHLGFLQSGIHSAMGNIAMAGKFAGISQQAAMDSYNADVMAGMQKGVDARLVYQDTLTSQYQMKTFQQSGQMSQAMSNPNTFLTASREARSAMHDAAKETTGVTRDMELFYAGHKSEKEGISVQKALDGLRRMSPSQKISEIYGYSNDMGYIEGLSNIQALNAYNRNIKGVESLNMEDDFSIVFKRHKKMLEDAGIKVTASALAANIYRGRGLDSHAIEIIKMQTSYALEHGLEGLSALSDQGKRMAKRREVMAEIGRAKERNTFYGKGKLLLKGIYESGKDFVGGYDSAGGVIDYSRSIYGNYAVGSFGKKEQMIFGGVGMSKEKKLDIANKLANSNGVFKVLKSKDIFRRDSDTNYGMDDSLGEDTINGAATIGKWAIIGAGVGSVIPAIGTVLGGAIGIMYGVYEESKFVDYRENRRKSLKLGGRRNRIDKLGENGNRDKLAALKTGEEMSKITGKTEGSSLELLSMINEGQTGADYLDMINHNDESGVTYNKDDVYSESDIKAIAPHIDEIYKKNKSLVAAMSDKEVSLELSRMKEEREDKFLNKYADILVAFDGDKEGMTKEIIDSGMLEGMSEDFIMDLYKGSDGIGKEALGAAIDSSGVMSLLSGGQQISGENQDKASDFVKAVVMSGLDKKQAKKLFKKAVSGTEEDAKGYIDSLRKSGGISAKEAILLSGKAEKLFSITETTGEMGVKVLSAEDTRKAALKKAGEGGQAAIDAMYKDLGNATGIKDRGVLEELTKIAQIEDPVEMMKAKAALGKKNSKVNNFSMDEVKTSIAVSSIFSDVKNGSDLLASGASDEIMQAKIYDAIERVAANTLKMASDDDVFG